MAAAKVRLTGHFKHADGRPAFGRVAFQPSVRVVDTTDDSIVTVTPVVAILGRDLSGFAIPGRFEVDLTATDGADVDPPGWTWIVTEQVDGLSNPASYPIALPASTGTVDLKDLAPVASFTPVVLAPPATYDGGTP